jgi:hypothetical protein
MDSAETTETKDDKLSINIHAPCNNQIYGGDHIEVHIHRDGSDRERRPDDGPDAPEEIDVSTATASRGEIDVMVPKALRIVRKIRDDRHPRARSA